MKFPISAAVWLTCITAGFSVAINSASAAPPPGRLLAAQCAQCHGTDGQSANDIESLAGESSQEILKELQEMRDSPNTNNIMHKQARGYSNEQMQAIADYFAQLPQASNDKNVDSSGSDDENND